ncbi:DUF4892 domain-containing protein [Thermodesulfobacteriota bacterium]
MRARASTLTSVAALMILASGMCLAADIQDSKDHPLVTRYSGSEIIEYEAKSYDEYRLVLGTPGRDANNNVVPSKSQHLEGKVTRILYKGPKGRSTLEVYRNYEKALKNAGFDTLFACSRDNCGGLFSYTMAPPLHRYAMEGGDTRYIAAKLSRKEGDVYVSLYIVEHTLMSDFMNHPMVQLDVVEMEPMDEGLVTVNAEAMADDITSVGHVALYGIYFDTNLAAIKPESAPALREMARLLRQNPDMSLYVVGHTDNVGGFEYNMDLSRRRAKAVAEALVSGHSIDGARLTPKGVGLLAPVASNETEEGRAKNRRVELVLK